MDGNTRVTYEVTLASAADAEEETPVEDEEPYTPKTEKTNPSDAAANDGTITIYNRDTRLELKILKVDATEITKYLTGAEFQLQKKNGSGTYVAYTKPVFSDSPYTDGSEAKLIIEDKDQGIIFQMLTDGDYKLVETMTPNGYVKPTVVEVQFMVEDGVVTPAINVDNTIVVGYTPAMDQAGPVVTIANTPGASLPNTGGPGTRLFTILGSILAAGAGLLLWRRRRLILQ